MVISLVRLELDLSICMSERGSTKLSCLDCHEHVMLISKPLRVYPPLRTVSFQSFLSIWRECLPASLGPRTGHRSCARSGLQTCAARPVSHYQQRSLSHRGVHLPMLGSCQCTHELRSRRMSYHWHSDTLLPPHHGASDLA